MLAVTVCGVVGPPRVPPPGLCVRVCVRVCVCVRVRVCACVLACVCVRAGSIAATCECACGWRVVRTHPHTRRASAVVCMCAPARVQADRRRALAEFYAALRHDGILILDQRNYDSILDVGFDSKHVYYYCGDQVTAEPEHVDDSLARFRYSFPDGSVYHLNMFPLRKNKTKFLVKTRGRGATTRERGRDRYWKVENERTIDNHRIL